ncbi:MAG: HAD-superfamily hydrolase, subfamily IA, variant 3 [uncultured bacterium]|nr:MAG: HAD-superfamily hydrolase, subfamily IA, variant 3 [uncultured bacterium]
MIKAILFDVDGVLVDSFEANHGYFKDIFEESGYVAPTRDEYRHMFHISLDDMIRLVAKNPGEREFQRIREISNGIKYPIEKMKPTEGSVETIKKLSKKYHLGIVTGRHENGTESYLEHSTLKECFKEVVHYGHYENPKPHPEPLLVALEKLGISPGEAVYIGDQKTDLESAEAAGIPFILYSEYDYGLDDIKWKAEKFSDIIGLIEEIKIGK